MDLLTTAKALAERVEAEATKAKIPVSVCVIDIHGNLVRTLDLKDAFSYAGVSQNGKRFALQVASFSGMHSIKHEKFVIYSVDTGEPITEVTP